MVSVRDDRPNAPNGPNGPNRPNGRLLTGRRSAAACAAALVSSAVLFSLGSGLSPVSALTWLAPLPVLALAPYVATWQALTVAFVSYVASTSNAWAFYTRSHDTPLWPAGVLIIVSFGLTLVLAVWVFRRLLTRGRVLLAMLSAPAMWVATLYLISVSNPMGIMGTLATSQAEVPPVVKIATVTGWSGVEYLVFFVPTAVAAVFSPGLLTAARARAAVAGALVVGLAMATGGLMRPAQDSDRESTALALVVHNDSGWAVDVDSAEGRELVDAYADEIAALPERTETVVLPEGAFGVDDRSLGTLTDRMTQVARERDMTLVVGYNRQSGGAKYNTALVIPPDGGEPVPYLKQHDMASQLGDDLVHQPDSEQRIGVAICLDVNFANPSREYAKSGTRLLLVPASDNDENGWQHARTGLLRGVENGFAVAWAGRNGQLMIAKGNGRVVTEGHTGNSAAFTTLTADVPDGPGSTFYTRTGDWFPWLTILLGLGGLASSWFPRARRRTPEQAR